VRTRRLNLLIAGLIVVRLLTFTYLVASHQDTVDGGIAGDVRRYDQMANAEGLHYRDFQVEYPTVTYAIIKLTHGPRLGVGITLVAISQLLCDILISFILRWVWSVRTQAAYLLLGLPLVAFPFVYARVDLATEEREHLLDQLGLFGVRLARDLLRRGEIRSAPALAAELARRSGLDEMRRVLGTHFACRAELLKARAALAVLDRVLRAAPPGDGGVLPGAVEEAQASAPEPPQPPRPGAPVPARGCWAFAPRHWTVAVEARPDSHSPPQSRGQGRTCARSAFAG